MKIFEDRTSAARELAKLLEKYRPEDAIVLALPRGGLPVGAEIARHLKLPLDVFVARKIGAPFNPEFGIGALAEGGIIVWDQPSLDQLRLSPKELENQVTDEELELQRRVRVYRGNIRPPQVEDKTVILADDGLATGITAQAAIRSLRLQKPKKIILTAPVCARDTLAKLSAEADEVICLHAPDDFTAVGLWYRNFEQLSDEDVIDTLAQSRKGEL